MANQNYITVPKSGIQLAEELKRAVDNYWLLDLPEAELKQLIWTWARSGKLLRGADIVPNVKKIIGKKRLEVVNAMLAGYQPTF